jgi:hypothetical protein
MDNGRLVAGREYSRGPRLVEAPMPLGLRTNLTTTRELTQL